MSTTTPRDEVIHHGNAALSRTLQAVMRYRRLTVKGLAEATGVPYNTTQRYTSGNAQLTGGYLEVFARALQVPRFVLAMDDDDALGWVLEHCPNGSLNPVSEGYSYGVTQLPDPAQPSLFDEEPALLQGSPEGVVAGRAIIDLQAA